MNKYKITMQSGTVLEVSSNLTKTQIMTMKQNDETWNCGYGIQIDMYDVDQIEVIND